MAETSDPEAPIAYIERTRDYYAALGYGPPYRWAQQADIAFARLARPLSESTVAVVTTAAPFQPGIGDQGPGAPYNAAAKFYDVYALPSDTLPDLRISHIAIDRDHTTAEDIGSYFPLSALRRAREANRVGRVAEHVYGLPTNRSQRATLEVDAAALLDLCRADGVEAAILVPNCPVCHQSVALAANVLEAAGIATVIMGCARDIVAHVGAPRFLFSDFPLGNAAGRPGDVASQTQTLQMALDLLEEATAPRTIRTSPLRWPGPQDWKSDYSNAARLAPEKLVRLRAAFDQSKRIAKGLRGG